MACYSWSLAKSKLYTQHQGTLTLNIVACALSIFTFTFSIIASITHKLSEDKAYPCQAYHILEKWSSVVINFGPMAFFQHFFLLSFSTSSSLYTSYSAFITMRSYPCLFKSFKHRNYKSKARLESNFTLQWSLSMDNLILWTMF